MYTSKDLVYSNEQPINGKVIAVVIIKDGTSIFPLGYVKLKSSRSFMIL